MPAQKDQSALKINVLLVAATLLVAGCDRQPAVGQASENLGFGFTAPTFTPPPPPCMPHSHPDITNHVCDCDPGYKVVGNNGADSYPICGIALPCYPHSSPDVTGNVCDCDPGFEIDRYPGADIYPICRQTSTHCNPNSRVDEYGYMCFCDPGFRTVFAGATSVVVPLCLLCNPGAVRVGDACVCDVGRYDDGTSTSADPSCRPCTGAMKCDQPGTTLASALPVGPVFTPPACPADQVLTAAGCVCPEGSYDAGSDGVLACVACPAGAACPAGTTALTLTPAPGYFRTDDTAPAFSRCLVPGQCN